MAISSLCAILWFNCINRSSWMGKTEKVNFQHQGYQTYFKSRGTHSLFWSYLSQTSEPPIYTSIQKFTLNIMSFYIITKYGCGKWNKSASITLSKQKLIMWFYLLISVAFDTVHPYLMIWKLLNFEINSLIIKWLGQRAGFSSHFYLVLIKQKTLYLTLKVYG